MLSAFWACRHYLIPQLRHFAVFFALTGIVLLMNIGITMFSSDLLTNKVFLAEPLNAFQASLLSLDQAEFVEVETLSGVARYQLRTIFLVLLATLVVSHFVLGQGLRYYGTWILQRVNQHLRVAMMDNAVQLSLRYHNKQQVGDAIYRIFQDSAMVVSVIQNGLIQPLILIGTFGFVLVVLAAFNGYLAALFLFAIVPSVVLAKVMTQHLRRQSRDSRLANSELTSHIQERIQGSKVLKALHAERGAFNTFTTRSQHALNRAYELRRTVVWLNLGVFFFTAIATIVADYLMVHFVWAKEATAGYGVIAVVGFEVWSLGAFQAAREQGGGASGSLVGMAYTWSLLQDMGVGLQRAMFLLHLEPDVRDAVGARTLPQEPSTVEFDAVSFSYERGNPILHDVSFKAAPGTVTAIVGGSGAGKSTLMNLLLRLYDVDAGAIRLSDNDVRSVRQDSLRGVISIVLQENALFPTSIAENVRFAAPAASDAAVQEALYIACADKFIAELPEGLGTELGERGAKLSTGQRQRISIARAIVKAAPILILDEPTASLDLKTEREILERIERWAHNKVVFLITHRVTTTAPADQVIYIENGTIAEIGAPLELLQREQGRYRAFVEAETTSVDVQ